MSDEERNNGFSDAESDGGGGLDRFDLEQEIARSAFADMCHDWERNQKYDQALRHTIKRLHLYGYQAHVLDIGTGSGLLSMMAVRAGADSVTACEAFRPMADCAEKVIRANGMAAQIRLVKKRSTAMVVGENGDMVRRANVLVTELFDTELIGEGAIATYVHALEHLLERDCRVIPHSATIYAQLVECPLAMSWQVPRAVSNSDGDVLLRTPDDIVACRGSSAVFDVQLSQMPEGSFNALTKPIPVFKFDFSTTKGLAAWRFIRLEMKPIRSGAPHAVFMWWDLKMNVEGDINLSCAPFWAHPDYESLKRANTNPTLPAQNVIPWRDHWMQAIYFLPHTKQTVSVGQSVHLCANHDEFSLWFSLDRPCVDPPHCTCGAHIAYSRSRIGQLNDGPRNKKILNYLEQVLDKNSVVLVLGDGSLLGAALSAMGVGKVILLETTQISRKCMEVYVSFNGLKSIEILSSVEELAASDVRNEITHIFGEPSFGSSILPWENALQFGAAVQRVKPLLNPTVAIIPSSFSIHAVPVEFLDLHKINAPLGTCEGFDLSCMDQMIEEYSNATDCPVEAQPLWEYPCFALEASSELIAISLTDGLPQTAQLSQGAMLAGSAAVASKCNGVAIWADWHMDSEVKQKTTVSTGPLLPVEVAKEPIRWNANWRQGVHLLRRPLEEGMELKWSVKFNERLAACYFQFDRVGANGTDGV